MNTLLQDVRFAWRGMRSRPGFSVVIVLTLAIGIGATTAVFSIVQAVLLRSLPYPEADRLVYIWSGIAGSIASARSLQSLLSVRAIGSPNLHHGEHGHSRGGGWCSGTSRPASHENGPDGYPESGITRS